MQGAVAGSSVTGGVERLGQHYWWQYLFEYNLPRAGTFIGGGESGGGVFILNKS